MKIAYFDCSSGVSGNMILGALVDAGVPSDYLQKELKKLHVTGYTLSAKKVVKDKVTSTLVDVKIKESKKERSLTEILKILGKSRLSPKIKKQSETIFMRLGKVEAKIHGKPLSKIHFHEVGSVDAIVDVAGSCIGLDWLGVEKVLSSPINMGSGFVTFTDGTYSVPPPAPLELSIELPIFATDSNHELSTPTGTAIVTTLAKEFGPIPPMTLQKIGYGAGTYQLPVANLFRLLIGETADSNNEEQVGILYMLETNIDDMAPNLCEYVMEKLFKHGALDVFFIPVVMKKSRPGILLSVLCGQEHLSACQQILFLETPTLGVRIQEVQRRALQRKMVTLKTKFGPLRAKAKFWNGNILSISPEYEDARRLALKKNVPLHSVINAAMQTSSLKPRSRVKPVA